LHVEHSAALAEAVDGGQKPRKSGACV